MSVSHVEAHFNLLFGPHSLNPRPYTYESPYVSVFSFLINYFGALGIISFSFLYAFGLGRVFVCI